MKVKTHKIFYTTVCKGFQRLEAWLISIKYNEYLLIKLLCNSQGFLSVKNISKTLNVTPRTVYTMFQKINDFLYSWNVEQIQNMRGHGYYLLPEAILVVNQKLQSLESEGEIELPSEERCQNIVILLMLNIQGQTVKELNSINHVSRSTTLKDIHLVQQQLVPYNLLINKQEGAFLLNGDELSIRTYALHLINNSDQNKEFDFAINLQSRLNPDKFEIIKLEALLFKFEEDSGKYFTDISLSNLKTYMCFMISRIRMGLEINEIGKLNQEEFIDLNKSTYSDLLDYFEYLNVSKKALYGELNFLIKVITTYQLRKINSTTPFYATLFSITGNIVQRFQNFSGLSFENDKDLKIQLYTHLIAARNRVRYNMQFHNDEAKNIKQKYHSIYLLTKKAISPFEDYLGKKLNDDELALVTIYLVASRILCK